MTQAADDFALIKSVVESYAYGDEKRGGDLLAAFNRLFTPRPLRELVAEGYTRFQTVPEGNIFEKTENGFESLYLDLFNLSHHEKVRINDKRCIPILTPQDMGVG